MARGEPLELPKSNRTVRKVNHSTVKGRQTCGWERALVALDQLVLSVL